jgi:hypothetical protein
VGSLGRSGGLEEEKKSSPILDNDYSLTHSHSITHSLTHTVIAHYTHTTPSHTHTHSFTQYTTTLIQHHTSRSHSFLTHYSPRYRPSWTTSNAWAYSNASNAS